MLVLNKMAKAERWQKMPKAAGILADRSLTKSGNLKLKLSKKEKETSFYVLKRNKNLFETGAALKKGDAVSVALRTYLGKKYCVKLVKKEMLLQKKKQTLDETVLKYI